MFINLNLKKITESGVLRQYYATICVNLMTFGYGAAIGEFAFFLCHFVVKLLYSREVRILIQI
jgi:hypothetical protein